MDCRVKPGNDSGEIASWASETAHTLIQFIKRQPLGIRIGAAAADFGQLLVGDAQIAPVREIIEHRRGGGILLAVRQLLDSGDSVAQKFRHI